MKSLLSSAVIRRNSSVSFIIPQESNARTPQLDNRVSDEIKHSPDLLVLSFVKQNLKPGIGFCFAQLPDFCRSRARAVLQCYTAPQAFDRLVLWDALHFCFIHFVHLVACGGDEIGDTIIGQQQQALGVEVEPAYW